MTGALVLLLVTICPVVPGGFGHSCDDMEIRARSCVEAMDWAAGWMPAGFGVARSECIEGRAS